MGLRMRALAVSAAALCLGGLFVATPAAAAVSVPDCDVDCVPVGGGGGGGGTPTDPMGTGVPTTGTIRVDFSVFLAGGVNDVATGPDGSIWTIGNGTTVCAAACTRTVTFGKGGQRLAVDQFGLPWIVGFDFTIWRGNAD